MPESKEACLANCDRNLPWKEGWMARMDGRQGSAWGRVLDLVHSEIVGEIGLWRKVASRVARRVSVGARVESGDR